MYVIQRLDGKFVASINPVSGSPTWTADLREARSWSQYHTAREMADGIGHVRHFNPVW